jgi:hypothetical protein
MPLSFYGKMLISKKHRFIFIHIYKTAGSSITKALKPFAQNKWQKKVNPIFKRFGITHFDPKPYPTHIHAAELKSKIGEKAFDSYFKFGIVRNPWDWQVSIYTYVFNKTSHPLHKTIRRLSNFDEYLEWRFTKPIIYQKNFLFSKQNKQIVDYIGRFENLKDDFNEICSRLNISATLRKRNISSTRPYQEYYNKKTIDLVRKKLEPDIRLFKYDFE